MKTKKLALALVSMFLFSAFYFSSCSSDALAPDASSVISKCKGGPTIVKDSLAADSLHHGKKPGCDSIFVKHPKPTHDTTFVKHPKPVFDSISVHHPKPVFDSLRNDTVRPHRPIFPPKWKHGHK
ncbi:MAG: hypothetical protein WCK78_00565 [Paludibacter sp.]